MVAAFAQKQMTKVVAQYEAAMKQVSVVLQAFWELNGQIYAKISAFVDQQMTVLIEMFNQKMEQFAAKYHNLRAALMAKYEELYPIMVAKYQVSEA